MIARYIVEGKRLCAECAEKTGLQQPFEKIDPSWAACPCWVCEARAAVRSAHRAGLGAGYDHPSGQIVLAMVHARWEWPDQATERDIRDGVALMRANATRNSAGVWLDFTSGQLQPATVYGWKAPVGTILEVRSWHLVTEGTVYTCQGWVGDKYLTVEILHRDGTEYVLWRI